LFFGKFFGTRAFVGAKPAAKVAEPRNFRENAVREMIDDSSARAKNGS
jgi:hypothetical protein